jgi:Protein of unknown function (DUF2909)
MSAVVLIVLALIVGSLGHALTSMSSGPSRSQQMVKALAVRVALSVALFALLLVGFHFGWISPHGMHKGFAGS